MGREEEEGGRSRLNEPTVVICFECAYDLCLSNQPYLRGCSASESRCLSRDAGEIFSALLPSRDATLLSFRSSSSTSSSFLPFPCNGQHPPSPLRFLSPSLDHETLLYYRHQRWKQWWEQWTPSNSFNWIRRVEEQKDDAGCVGWVESRLKQRRSSHSAGREGEGV